MILKQNKETGYWTKFDGGYDLTSVHDPALCEGRGCAVHNHPSDHALKDASLNWREDRGILERICKHGVGHDDYDSVVYLKSLYNIDDPRRRYVGTHGCCGCC